MPSCGSSSAARASDMLRHLASSFRLVADLMKLACWFCALLSTLTHTYSLVYFIQAGVARSTKASASSLRAACANSNTSLAMSLIANQMGSSFLVFAIHTSNFLEPHPSLHPRQSENPVSSAFLVSILVEFGGVLEQVAPSTPAIPCPVVPHCTIPLHFCGASSSTAGVLASIPWQYRG